MSSKEEEPRAEKKSQYKAFISMLSKENRLRKKQDFEVIFNQGKTLKYDFLIIRVAENKTNNTRFAFLVSKKISSKAFERNIIKRRLRELVRSRICKTKKGFDIVFIASHGIKGKTYQELDKVMEYLFLKMKLYN